MNEKTILLKKLTTFQDVGEVSVKEFDDLNELVSFIKNYKLLQKEIDNQYKDKALENKLGPLYLPEFIIIGKGSNLLISPKTKKQLICLNKKILPFEIKEEQIFLNAAYTSRDLLLLSQKNGLSGFEFVAGVPTSVGGMLAMNYGCYGQIIAQIVERVLVLNELGELHWYDKDALGFGYRSSIFQEKSWIIIGAWFKLAKLDQRTIRKNIETYLQKRKLTQPLGVRTFGSIFKNPAGNFAGKILEDLGYKGKKFGNLLISDKHANFLVNLGNVQFNDVVDLLKKIQQDVLQKTGIILELEVKIVA